MDWKDYEDDEKLCLVTYRSKEYGDEWTVMRADKAAAEAERMECHGVSASIQPFTDETFSSELVYLAGIGDGRHAVEFVHSIAFGMKQIEGAWWGISQDTSAFIEAVDQSDEDDDVSVLIREYMDTINHKDI